MDRISKVFIMLVMAFSVACSNYGETPISGVSSSDNAKDEYQKGEVLVMLKEGVSPSMVFSSGVTKSTGGMKVSSYKRVFDISPAVKKTIGVEKFTRTASADYEGEFNKISKSLSRAEQKIYRIYKIAVDSEETEAALQSLKKNNYIEDAWLNRLNKLYSVPNDTLYNDLYGIQNIQSADAWNITEGDTVIVGVIDSGVDYNHPDIKDNMWTDANGKYGYDFSDNDDDPLDDDVESNGHGSHVAGTIGAVGNNGIGVIGVAPRVKIMAIKVFPNAYDDVFAQAIKYAVDNGAQVINNSWGPMGPRPSAPLIEAALDYAYENGVIAVFAAGNENQDVKDYSPANYGRTISVAAVDENDIRASFSNYGPLVDVSAPGVDILSLSSLTTGYKMGSGTSMAAPHVTGLVALLLAENPDLTFEDARFILKNSSDSFNTAPAFPIGSGRINAYSALNYVQNVRIPGNVKITSYTSSSLGFSWHGVDNADKYKVYRRSETEDTFTELAEISSGTSEGIRIYYRSNMMNNSSVVNIHYNADQTNWTSVPGVEMTTVSGGSYDGWKSKTIEASRLEFVLNNNSGIWDNNNGQNYQINASGIYTLDNGNLQKIGDYPSEPATTYVDSNLEEGTFYHYKIKAFSGTMESGFSEPICGLTEGLSAPKASKVLNVSDNSIEIIFGKRPGGIAYKLFRSNSLDGDFIEINELSGRKIQVNLKAPSWQWTTAPWATYIEYRTANGPWISKKMAYWDPMLRHDCAYINFHNMENIEFTFYRGDSYGSSGTKHEVIDNNGEPFKISSYGYYDIGNDRVVYKMGDGGSGIYPKFFDSPLLSGTTYYYKLKSVGVNNEESGFGNVITGTTTGISTPLNLKVDSFTATTVNLSWDSSANGDSYTIYRSTDDGVSYAEVGNSLTTTYTDSGLSSGTTYYYRVKAKSSGSESSYSDFVSVTPVDNFLSTYDHVYLRGTSNGWQFSEMTLVSDYTWEVVETFGAGDASGGPRFKFDMSGDWSLNFGDNNSDNYIDQSGNDISVSSAKTYKIRLNDMTGYYSIEEL